MSGVLRPVGCATAMPVVRSAAGVDVWVWRNLATSFRAERHTAVLDDIERRSLAGFAAPGAARAFAAGRAMIRVLLARYARVAPTEIRFVRGAHGKPCVISPVPAAALAFNLSHAADSVVVAVTQGGNVGIDIEGPRAFDIQAVAGEAFTLAERAALEGQTDDVRLHRFLRIWTLKEAFVKTIGTGFSMPPDAFTIDPFVAPRELSLVDTTGTPLRFSQYGLEDGLIVALGDAVATHRKVLFHTFDATQLQVSGSLGTGTAPPSYFEYTTPIVATSTAPMTC